MEKPRVADVRPAVLDLEPGTYFWCRCGLSDRQPFCNGAHKTTAFTPLKVVLEEPKRVALCQCKSTGNAPYCDGTHKRLQSAE